MAIVTKKWSDQEGGAELWTDVYEVTEVETGLDAIAQVALGTGDASPGITLNTPHPSNPILKAQAPTFRTPRGPKYFEVWVRYALPPSGDWSSTNPLLDPPEISWRLTIVNEPIDRDIDGNVIIYSSREVPDPGPTDEVYLWALTITRNESFFNFIVANDFKNTVNQNSFTVRQPNGGTIVFPGGVVRCNGIVPAETYKTTATYVKMAYSFEFKEFFPWVSTGSQTANTSPFQLYIANQGFRGFWGAQKTPGPFVHSDGSAIDSPILTASTGVPLDNTYKVKAGDGDFQSAVANTTPPGATALAGPSSAGGDRATYLVWRRKRPKDFAALNL